MAYVNTSCCWCSCLVAYAFLNLWMSLQIGKARNKVFYFYPNMYAVESENKGSVWFVQCPRTHFDR